jgi:long-subunit fatty acid transport protein
MKKLVFTIFGFFLAINLMFGGGIVTNTNQSTTWTRMLARDASTSIDAVYYNPAGLTKLSDGLHISVSNQSIFQTRTISNSLFPGKEWEGKVNVPFYPNLYVAYKTGKFAFSAGFTPIGGGGSAKYDNGIPMIEMLIAGLPANFTALGANGNYSYTSSFEGSSVYYGIQGGVSYEINDIISVYAGARYVMAKNSYKGEITNILLNSVNPNMPFLTNGILTTAAGNYQAGVVGINNAYSGGATAGTLVSAVEPSGGPLTTLLAAVGYPSSVNLGTAQVIFNQTAAGFTLGAGYLADKELDAEQTGSGYTPILGANIALMEDKINIGIKYEFKTNMEVTNKTTKDVAISQTATMFPDGAKTNADIPAMLSIGASYKFSDKFSAQAGYHTYFDKGTGWSVIKDSNPEISKIDKNFWEASVGLEYSISDKILISCGYLAGVTGVNSYYNSDLGFSLNSTTLGLGGAYIINDMISLEIGAFNSWYKSETAANPSQPTYTQTYGKSNMGISLGLNFSFGGE